MEGDSRQENPYAVTGGMVWYQFLIKFARSRISKEYGSNVTVELMSPGVP